MRLWRLLSRILWRDGTGRAGERVVEIDGRTREITGSGELASGNWGCFGMELVTEGDRGVEGKVKGRRGGPLKLSASLGQPVVRARKCVGVRVAESVDWKVRGGRLPAAKCGGKSVVSEHSSVLAPCIREPVQCLYTKQFLYEKGSIKGKIKSAKQDMR
jgi:hypothetical protein